MVTRQYRSCTALGRGRLAERRPVHDIPGALAGDPAIHGVPVRESPRLFPDGRYPPNTLLIADRLVGEKFLIEVQAVATL